MSSSCNANSTVAESTRLRSFLAQAASFALSSFVARGRNLFEKQGAGSKRHGEILLRLHPLLEVALPRLEMIFFSHQGVPVAADLRYWKFSPPAVISQGQHFHGLPTAAALLLPQQSRSYVVVPVPEDVRLYSDQVADDSLDWKEATIQLWFYVFNNYPASSLVRLRH